MAFDCTHSKASIRTTRSWRGARKGAAALALAVAAAAPVVALPSLSRASEFEEAMVLLAEQAKPTDAELLTKGVEQYNQGRFEDAQITLQQIKTDALAQGDRGKLTDTMRKVESALSQRQAARAAFLKGEEAANAKNYDEAIKQYRAASENKFADAATREKAAAQLAVAQAAKPAALDKNAYFKEAIADYKAGRLDVAREKFVKLDGMGFKGGLFDTRPKEYVEQIDKKLAAQASAKAQPAASGQPKVVAAAANNSTTAPAATVPGKVAYDQGVEAYRKGDFATARVRFAEAQGDGYVPPAQFDSPARYIAMIDQKEAATQPAKAGPVAAAGTIKPAAAGVSAEEQALRATANIETARDQYRQYEVQVLLQKARQAQEDNRLTEAYAFFKRAHDLQPDNKEAGEGVARLQAMIVGAPQQNLLQDQMQLIDAQKAADRYYFNQAIAEAKAAISAGEFDRVPELLDRANAARNAHAELFSRAELAEFDAGIRGIREANQQGMAAAEKQQRAEQIAQATAEQQAEQERIRDARRKKVMDLTQKSKDYIHDRNYIDGLKAINQILTIDPTNEWASGVKRLVQDNAVIQEERRYREDFDRNFEQQLDRAEEAKTPYIDIIRYPDNWPEISEMRDREVAAERRGGVADEYGPRAALDMKLPDVNFRGQGLADAVQWFRDMTGANVFVHWAKLEAAGIQPTTKIHDVQLRNTKAAVALNTLLADVGNPAKLGYTIEDGMITITTAEELASNTVMRTYDIRDLLIVEPDLPAAPPATIRDRMIARERERAMARGAYNSFGPTGPATPVYSSGQVGTASNGATMAAETGLTDAQKADRRVADIIDTIKRMVDRESWIGDGGKIGDIRYIQGQLAVTQTPENQRQVVGLLDRLRELHAIQVQIETRFLTIQRNYLEDIGLDIDFFFNINNPDHWSPIAVSQQSADFTAGTAAATAAPGTIAGATGGLKPAITVGGSFLDDYQVNFLIRATQADRHSTIMTAPRVTVWNGQLASLTVGTTQAYVSDLEAVTSGGSLYGAVAYNPIVSTILSGVSLAVRPTVTADRKYVTLSLTPSLSQLVDLVTYAISTTTTNGNTNNNQQPTGTPTQNIGVGNIQLPLTQITTLQTIVTVPDGGTLLLGGQTIAGEVEVEEGVPILSKIPFLKRLFTNRSTAKDEQVLLILVRPTILIQREMEQNAFPLLNTRTSAQ